MEKSRQSDSFLLAIDVGTSALKTVLYDRDGQVLASANSRYSYTSPAADWAEADPADWWQALIEAAAQMQQAQLDLQSVEVIALTGQMHTAVLLDKENKPLAPTILWLDRRAAAETGKLQEKLQMPPYQLNSTYTLPKLYWLAKHRPQVMAQVRTILWPKDYLRFRLTGELMSDPTEAGGAALLDWQTLDWAPERLALIGLDPAILPPLRSPHALGGRLLSEVADLLGLRSGTPVIVGAGDVLALITAAPPAIGRVTCSLGSSSMVFCPVEDDKKDIGDPQGRIYPYPLLPYRLLGGVSSTTGAALHWAWSKLYEQELPFERAVSSALETTSPGAEGLFFLPFLSGERSPYWSDTLRGGFYGLGLSHGRPHFLRAVMEGVAFSLRYLLDVFAESGVTVSELALAGGGASTPGWAQMIADVCGCPAAMYTGQETVTRGLFAYGYSALNPQVTFEQALLSTFQQPEFIEPAPENTAVYERIYARYCRLADFADQVLSEL